MNIRTAYSEFRSREITFLDDCGCASGAIHEEELTEHGFNGAHWIRGYLIKCSNCNKTLTELPPTVQTQNDKK